MITRKTAFIPALASLIFLLIALVLLPYPGIQNDEAFFAGAIYSPDNTFYSAAILGHKIPWMVMSYSGALKSWIFAGLWGYLFDPNAWSLRLPMVAAGIGTLLLTWVFVRRLAGVRAAALTLALLATDTCFQLTNTFDWGPVALQHLLLMAGLVGIFAWIETRRRWTLLLGAFCWGLGLWDKALLIWPLFALGVATLAVYPKESWKHARQWIVVAALGMFLLGASPLIWYNFDKPGDTATANVNFSLQSYQAKLRELVTTTDGAALFDYMVRGNWATNPRKPIGLLEKTSVGITHLAGERRHNLMVWGFLLALGVGLWRRTRLTVYLAIVLTVTWLQMFLTKNTGGTAHHVILLWPFPLVLIGIALAKLPSRISTGLVAVLVFFNLLTTNEYVAEFAQFGTTVNWTDAIYSLSDTVNAKTASEIEILDWGYLNGLGMLHEGNLPLKVASEELLKPVMSGADRETIRTMIESPRHLFIRHTAGNEIFFGIDKRLRDTAEGLGYREKPTRVVNDKNGRPIFELFRFEKN